MRLVRVEIPALKKAKTEGVKLPSRVEQIAKEIRGLLKDVRKA